MAKRMLKKLIVRVVLALILLLVIAVGLLWAFIDPLAKKGVESGATYALGVQTGLDEIEVSLLHSDVSMEGLTIANPEGFNTPHLLKSEKFHAGLRPMTVLRSTVEMSDFTIDGVDVNFEQNGLKSNVMAVMDNLKKFESDKKDTEEAKSGKKIKFDKLVIRNIVVHVTVNAVPGLNAKPLTIKLPPIEEENFGSDDADGVYVSQLTFKIIGAILESAVKAVADSELGGKLKLKEGLQGVGGMLGDLLHRGN